MRAVKHIDLFYHLYKRGFFTESEITEKLEWISDNYIENSNQISLFLCWFKDEAIIEEFMSIYPLKDDKQLTLRELEQLNMVRSIYLPYSWRYANRFLSDNMLEKLEIDEIIKSDDADRLQEIISSVGFNINEKVGRSILRHPFLQYNPTLLNLCEF